MAVPRPTRSPARPAAVLAVLTLLAATVALLALSGTAHAQDLNCREDFEYQEDAQAVLDRDRSDPNNLDSNGDGVACETLPRRGSSGTTTTTTTEAAAWAISDPTTTAATSSSTSTTASTTSTVSATTTSTTSSDSDDDSGSSSDDSDSGSSSSTSGDDKDCADFTSQADAQAALTAESGDPDNLDADDDGIACEDRFGQAGQQVQVHPTGGVDTGGDA